MRLSHVAVPLLKPARLPRQRAWPLAKLPLEPSCGERHWESLRPQRNCGHLGIHPFDRLWEGPRASRPLPSPKLYFLSQGTMLWPPRQAWATLESHCSPCASLPVGVCVTVRIKWSIMILYIYWSSCSFLITLHLLQSFHTCYCSFCLA